MWSSECTRSSSQLRRVGVTCFATLTAAVAWSTTARAQQQAEGFGVERLYLSAPGGGWFVMDSLDMRGGLGGAMAGLTIGVRARSLANQVQRRLAAPRGRLGRSVRRLRLRRHVRSVAVVPQLRHAAGHRRTERHRGRLPALLRRRSIRDRTPMQFRMLASASRAAS